MATFITSTPRATLHSLAWQGFVPTECHAQLNALISADLDPAHARLLATPVFDPDRSTVDWYSPEEGSVTPIADLPAEERDSLLNRMTEMGLALRRTAENLQQQTGAEQKVLGGHLLALALRYPDPSCLYRVGDQPVLICWGFEPATTGAQPQDISRLFGAPFAAAPAAPAAPAPPTQDEKTPLPPVTPVEVQRSGCLASLLWLLLPLLLLLLLLALLLTSWGGRMPLLSVPNLPAFQSSTDMFSASLPELDIERQRQLELLARIDNLRARADLCSRTTSPRPERQKLVIPEQAANTGDMSFLAGVWECETGLRESANNAPVTVLYSFDTNGTGYVVINSSKGLCKSGVAASFDDQGRLTFKTDDSIPCPDGVPFSGQEVMCKDENGEALCNGRNISTSGGEWDAVFKRKE